MRRRIGGRQTDLESPPRQGHGDGRRDRRFSDAPLAHGHDHPMTGNGQFIDQRR